MIIVFGGVALVKPFGLQGVMIASIASNLYRTIDLLIYVPHHITHNSIMRTARRIFGVFVNTIVVCIPIFFIDIKPTSYLTWVLYAFVLGIYAVIIIGLITFVLDKTEFRALKTRLFGMFMRRR